MISIFLMAYNEELLMKFMIDHYRTRFPGCFITVYDNESTDNTAAIAKENDCTVIPYPTGGWVDDHKLKLLKDTCWKTATTEWVLVCDTDEMLDINESDLKKEDALGTTIIKSEAYNMINLYDNYDIAGIDHGTRCQAYDKDYLFKRTAFTEINYCHGGHRTNPVGTIKPSSKKYICWHYINVNPQRCFEKHQYTKARMSEMNKRNGWGTQYNKERTMEDIIGNYKNVRNSPDLKKVK